MFTVEKSVDHCACSGGHQPARPPVVSGATAARPTLFVPLNTPAAQATVKPDIEGAALWEKRNKYLQAWRASQGEPLQQVPGLAGAQAG